MVSFTTAALSSIAAAGLVQYAPAPFLPVIGVAVTIEMGSAAAWAGAAGGILGGSAAVATAISNSKKKSVGSEFPVKPAKRQDPQYGTQLAWELCRDDVGSATIGMERSGNDLLVTGMPATCMTLATTITGQFNAGRPVPQGNDAILFTDLEEQYFTEIADALRARGD